MPLQNLQYREPGGAASLLIMQCRLQQTDICLLYQPSSFMRKLNICAILGLRCGCADLLELNYWLDRRAEIVQIWISYPTLDFVWMLGVVVWLYHVRVRYENYRENLRCEICFTKHQQCVLEISSNTSYFCFLNGF